MQKILINIIFAFVALSTFSCAVMYAPMRINTTRTTQHPPIDADAPFAIYTNPRQIPIDSERIGRLEAVCTNSFIRYPKCDSISMFNLAENRAREIGGNALLITRYREPTRSRPQQLNARVIRVNDFSSPPDIWYGTYGKGTWNLRLSVPYVNNFRLKPESDRLSLNTGFWGISLGFDYFHRDNQFLSFIASGVIDYFLPVLMGVTECWQGVEKIYERESNSSRFIALTNNHRIGHFSLGYGLSFSRNFWWLSHFGGYNPDGTPGILPPNRRSAYNSLGLMFTAYINPTRNFGIGVIYRPSFIRFNTSPTFQYEHLISVDFAWRIRLRTVRPIRYEH